MSQLERLLQVMAQLRDPEKGCTWDIAQSFESIAPYTIEEAYELADAITRRDVDDIRDELGDLLLQVVFHSQIANDEGLFEFEDVARTISDKMVRRHPHVFGDKVYRDIAEQKADWERIKAQERAARTLAPGVSEPSALDGVTLGLPALSRAMKIQKKASAAGMDWSELAGVYAKLDEETEELRQADAAGSKLAVREEFGDLLFTVVNLGRLLGVGDPETALREATGKFENRFKAVECMAESDGTVISRLESEQLDAYWVCAKAKQSDSNKP